MSSSYSALIRVYYEDTDAGAVVYYANYLKFFERVRSDWLRSFGLLHVDLRAHYNAMFVVHEASLKYHRPARLDDLLRVDVRVLSHRRASMRLSQQAVRVTQEQPQLEGELIASAEIEIAYLDYSSLRPKPFPQLLLDQLTA